VKNEPVPGSAYCVPGIFFTGEDTQVFTEIYVAKSGVKAAQNIAKRYSFQSGEFI